MIGQNIIDAAKRVSESEGIEPEITLAFIATETSGQPFEPHEGRTPTILCEPAVFFRQLPASKRAEALKQGLALRS